MISKFSLSSGKPKKAILEHRSTRFCLTARVKKVYNRGFIFRITKRTKKCRNNFKFKSFNLSIRRYTQFYTEICVS